jgi:hypothetical protein
MSVKKVVKQPLVAEISGFDREKEIHKQRLHRLIISGKKPSAFFLLALETLSKIP